MEADDYCSIRARESKYAVIATIDKDLDSVPGWHYNYQKKRYYHVSAEDADDMEWIQTLTGDSTDNIPGIHRLGPVAAGKFVRSWRKLGLSDSEKWAKVVELYEAARQRYPERYPKVSSAEELALEQTRLVRLLRTPGVLWTPPGREPDVIDSWGMEE